MSYRLIILGTGGSALDVLDVIDALNAGGAGVDVIGFLDDGRRPGETHLELPVLGPLTTAARHSECVFINTIGNDRNHRQRGAIIARTGLARDRFVTLVHPQASVSRRSTLGAGVCVNHGVSVGGRAVIGDHVYLCPGAIIGHDAVIGDHSIVAPGAAISGFVKLGEHCYVGAGATVRQAIHLGAQSLIGMGAVVVRDVEAGATVVGNPATVRRTRAEG